MASSRTYLTEAIVLRRTERGEADRIITLFTREFGKLKALARGVRKPKSKQAGLVEMFTHSSIQLARGRGMDVIAQGETLHPFLPLKTDLERAGQSFYIVELVNRFTAEHQENEPLFDLLLNTLINLCGPATGDMALRCFELELLQYVGYRPNLRRCADCNATLEPKTNAFSPAGGGIICPLCAGSDPSAYPITVNAVKILRLLQDRDYATLGKVNIGKQLSSELEKALRSYIEYLLERKVQSVAFLENIRNDTLHTG